MRIQKIPTLLLTLALGVSATVALADEAVTLTHVHGLSYSPDGARIMIPSHHGLALYERGKWSKASGPPHDYMGFSGTRDALYSSGHPAPNSGLVNPFGLIKSSDGGKTWKKLGLERESDFHVLATSYGTNAVYVVNHGANSRMSQPGIFHTRNDGLKWTKSSAKGLSGAIQGLAVHPLDPMVVVAATEEGLFVSRDAGETFDRRLGGQRALAAGFELDGQHLWVSVVEGQPALLRLALKSGASPQKSDLPPLNNDAVAYVAQNPVRPGEIAIATYRRNVFLSKDMGKSWSPIALEGVTRE